MAALTAARNTRKWGVNKPLFDFLDVGVKAGSKLYNGGIVARDSSGYGVAGLTATGLIVLGIADLVGGQGAVADNTGGASGAVVARVAQGVFRVNNSSAGDLIVAADCGKRCYLVDDQTVAKTSNTGARSVAGIIHDVDASGVWVLFLGQLAVLF